MTDLLSRPPSPVASPGAGAGQQSPLKLRRVDTADLAVLAGSGFSAFCLLWLVYGRLTPLAGGLGFWLCWYVVMLAIYGFIVRDQRGALAAKDRLATVAVSTAGLVLLTALSLIVGYTAFRGFSALRPRFFTQTLATVGPLSEATEGGGAHAIVGTLQQVGLAMLLSVPLGVATAVFLNEIGGRLARPVRLIVDAMSALPSIVAGLFIYAALIIGLGWRQSGFAAGIALSVLMLPTVTRTAEVVLRLVPGGLREGALALGGTEWRMARLVILPTARTGLVTAVILGVARAVGETAPLLLVSGGNPEMRLNPFASPQESLPYFIFRQVRLPQASQIDRAWTGALVLLLIVLVLFIAARILGGRGAGQVGWFRKRARALATKRKTRSTTA